MAINLLNLNMQLIDCKADGIRICRIEGQSLVTVVIPRSELSKAKNLSEIPQRGIYYLLNESNSVLNKVYAGQTCQGITRLDAHKATKDFWNKAVMFLDTDINISRDVLDELEAMAIGYIKNNGSYETDNTITPAPNKNPYNEKSVLDMHKAILFRMEVLGFGLNNACHTGNPAKEIFHTKRNGVKASGCYDNKTGEFTVLAGSLIDLDKPIVKNKVVSQLRESCFSNRTGRVELKNDVTFKTPSAAAVFVLGGSQNGWAVWVDSSGNTLSNSYRNT